MNSTLCRKRQLCPSTSPPVKSKIKSKKDKTYSHHLSVIYGLSKINYASIVAKIGSPILTIATILDFRYFRVQRSLRQNRIETHQGPARTGEKAILKNGED